MIFGVLGSAGSIGSRHAINLMTLGHQVFGYDLIHGNSMMSREDVIEQSQAVIICTPTRQHMEDMIDCKGKHILVEKPMAFDMWPEALRGFCQGKTHCGEIVAVGTNLRFHHCVQETKRLLDGGMIGNVGWATFRVDQKTTKPTYLMDGCSRNWGSHEIDLALHLLGPAQLSQVTNIKLDNNNDVEIEFTLQHDSGTFSTLHMDYLTEPEKRGYRLVGSKGVIEVDLVARTLQLDIQHGRSINHMKDSWNTNYLSEMKAFITKINGNGPRQPLATGLDGADTMEIILNVRTMAGLKDQ